MTQANEKPELTTWSKVFVVIAILLSLGNLINFIFYGQELRNIASCIGFALMAYGTYRNVQAASMVGLLFAAGAIAARYLL